jgi:phospholipid transport system substrate-binding protein
MRKILRTAVLLCSVGAVIPAFAQTDGTMMAGEGGASGHASATAETFVAENITKSLAILNNSALTEQQRSQQFEALLLSLTDMRRIGIFTLGQYAKAATAADQDAFVTAFQAYSEAVYRSYFNQFSGQKLVVIGSSQRAPDDFIVGTKLINPNDHSGQAPMEVIFRVRTDGDKPVVTDLNVMGAWLAVSQRDQFGSYLASHGGSVSTLTDNVRTVTARLH